MRGAEYYIKLGSISSQKEVLRQKLAPLVVGYIFTLNFSVIATMITRTLIIMPVMLLLYQDSVVSHTRTMFRA